MPTFEVSRLGSERGAQLPSHTTLQGQSGGSNSIYQTPFFFKTLCQMKRGQVDFSAWGQEHLTPRGPLEPQGFGTQPFAPTQPLLRVLPWAYPTALRIPFAARSLSPAPARVPALLRSPGPGSR